MHGIAARANLQSPNLFVHTTLSDAIEALRAPCQSNLATPSERRADRTKRVAMARIPGSIDGVGGTEALHGIAARAKLQSPNLFVHTTLSDAIEALTAPCQSNLATPSERRADRTKRVAMARIPGSIDGVGGTEALHGIAARAKLQSRNLFVHTTLSDAIEALTAPCQMSVEPSNAQRTTS